MFLLLFRTCRGDRLHCPAFLPPPFFRNRMPPLFIDFFFSFYEEAARNVLRDPSFFFSFRENLESVLPSFPFGFSFCLSAQMREKRDGFTGPPPFSSADTLFSFLLRSPESGKAEGGKGAAWLGRSSVLPCLWPVSPSCVGAGFFFFLFHRRSAVEIPVQAAAFSFFFGVPLFFLASHRSRRRLSASFSCISPSFPRARLLGFGVPFFFWGNDANVFLGSFFPLLSADL